MKNPGLIGGEYPEKPEPDTDTIARAIRKANERSGMLTTNTVLTTISCLFTALLGWIGSNAMGKLDTASAQLQQLSVQVGDIREDEKETKEQVRDHEQKISVLWDDHQSKNMK